MFLFSMTRLCISVFFPFLSFKLAYHSPFLSFSYHHFGSDRISLHRHSHLESALSLFYPKVRPIDIDIYTMYHEITRSCSTCYHVFEFDDLSLFHNVVPLTKPTFFLICFPHFSVHVLQTITNGPQTPCCYPLFSTYIGQT